MNLNDIHAVDRYPDHLHPALAKTIRALALDLGADTPFAIFETFRSPARQAHVAGRGTSKALPWQSAHQFGLACDFAVKRGDAWEWPDADDPIWDGFHSVVKRHGLVCPISWDPGHVQLKEDWRKICRE